MSEISERIASYVAPDVTSYEWQRGYRRLQVDLESDGWWFRRLDSRQDERGAAKLVEVGDIENVDQLDMLFRWLEAGE